MVCNGLVDILILIQLLLFNKGLEIILFALHYILLKVDIVVVTQLLNNKCMMIFAEELMLPQNLVYMLLLTGIW